MYLNILKRDLKRKKTMNIIITLFIILAVTFISSSVNNLTAVTSSLDTYFAEAGVGDYIAFERGNDGKSVAEIARGLEYVDDVKTEDIIYVTDGIKHEDEIIQNANGMNVISSFDNRIQNYYDSHNDEITEVSQGSVYIIKSYLDNEGISVGDKITIPIGNTNVTLTVKGVLKDAALGGRLLGTTRFLVSKADFDRFMTDENIEPYKGVVTFVYTDNISDFKQVLNECQNIMFSGSVSVFKFFYVMEMIVVGLLMIVSIFLIIIALVILRFTITFTLSEEYREIGIMKAIGVPNGKIRGLYFVKYFAISVVSAVVGLVISIPFGDLLLMQTSESIMISSSGSFLLQVICAIFVIAIIMLFCYRSTRLVKSFTPVDAIRNGSTGERYKKKGVLKMSKLHLSPVPFMAVNDIISGIRRFGIMMVTFTIGMLLISIVLGCISTLQSRKFLSCFSMAESDVVLINGEMASSYYSEDGREQLESDIKDTERVLSENSYDARVFVEVCYRFTITKGELSTTSMTFEGVNTTTDMYNSYIEGTPPQNTDEIAITFIIAEKIDAAIGDTVTITSNEGDKDYIVSAIYQSMSSLGESIRFHQDEHYNFEYLAGVMPMQIKFNDNPSDAEVAERIEKIKELYPNEEIMSASEYVASTTGGAYFNDIKSLIVLVVILINILVAMLMEKSFLTKERGEIAMLKAIGFKNRSIILWQVLRIAIIMMFAILIAIALSTPVSEFTSGAIFRMMGLKYIIFDVNVLENYVIYPLIVFATTVFFTFLITLSIRKINSNEINSIE